MNIKRSEITWAPHIPLIGGLPLGVEKALGKPPEMVVSLDGFWTNDSQYMHYQNETKGRNIDYLVLDADDMSFKKKINIVVSTCPCASLSSLNTGKSKEVRGCQAAKNEFMYITAEQAIKCFDADIIIGENAPALYTNKGVNVANNIKRIAQENNYGLTLLMTNTIFHGLPQNRKRTFYILWKGGKAPMMEWIRKEFTDFKEYILQVPENALDQDVLVNNRIGNTEPYFNFIKHKTGKDPREILIAAKMNTAFKWVQKNGLLEEALEWFKEINHEQGIMLTERAIYKFSIGKGIWDGSTHVFDKAMNAVIGRNLADTIHPIYDRSLTVREAFHMMGFPSDFELVGNKRAFNLIAQNVPVTTAASITEEAIKFLNGGANMTDHSFIRQNNINMKVEAVE